MSEHKLAILVQAIGAAKAAKDIKSVEGAVTGVGARAGKGLKTFGENLKGAFTTPLGLLGITGGLFGLEQIISESIGKAQEFGTEVSRMMKITGLTAETTSALASALEHFGIAGDKALKIAGMAEKNIGALGTVSEAGAKKVKDWNKTHLTSITTQQKLALLYPKAVKFQKDYGFSILTSGGKVKDFNTLLLDSADFFNNKSVPAQKKAAAMAKLYGRSWQDLVPVLSAGRAGIQGAEEEAQRLGLTLTKDNLDALNKNREATRKWNTALGGLELQIGLRLLPHLTDLANTASSFVSQHGQEITQFFDDASKFASDLGGAIHDDVLPAFQAIGNIWSQIPSDLKKILIAGFAVNKLSGGAITGIVSELGKGLIKGVLGMTAGVVNIKAGIVNGGVPGQGGSNNQPVPTPGGKPGSNGTNGEPGAKPGEPSTGGEPSVNAEPRMALGGAAAPPIDFSEADSWVHKINEKLHLTNDKIGHFNGALDKGIGILEHGSSPAHGPTSGNRTDKANATPAHILAQLKKDKIDLGAIAQHRLDSLATSSGQAATNAAAGAQATRDMDKNLGSAVQTAATNAADGATATRDMDKNVGGAVRSAGSETSRATQAAGLGIQAQTRSSGSTVTAATNVGASRIVGAIQASKPVVTTNVVVNVTPAGVTKSTTTNTRNGPTNGSGGSGSNQTKIPT